LYYALHSAGIAAPDQALHRSPAEIAGPRISAGSFQVENSMVPSFSGDTGKRLGGGT
jgi:hypothetical protein